MTAPFRPLVAVSALADRGLIVADARLFLDGRSARAAYDAGHIPGAVFVDVERDLVGPVRAAGGGRHPLPEPAAFAAAMSGLGIGDGDAVVAYDESGGALAAARLWWMLRVTGHRAAMLDGGLAAWDGDLSTVPA